MIVYSIAAISENNAIGKDGDLPWHLPDDLKFFKEQTLNKPVIMGRKNFESIPHKFRPLPKRTNIVLTRQEHYDASGVEVFHSLEKALNWCEKQKFNEVYVIGGGEIYAEAIKKGLVDIMYLTRVNAQVKGDAFYPQFDESEWECSVLMKHDADERHDYSFTFEKWSKK